MPPPLGTPSLGDPQFGDICRATAGVLQQEKSPVVYPKPALPSWHLS